MKKCGQLKFIDLFSGAGGMSFGFARHPMFRPVFAVDAQCGKPSSGPGSLECNLTYTKNIGLEVREADLASYAPELLLAESGLAPGELDVLISCAPCTGFSRTLRKNHLEDDERNSLVQRTGDFVALLRPQILVMENARELIRGNFSHHYHKLRERLEQLGYSVSGEIHMLSEFGLPQVRERALIIAHRDHGQIHTLRDLWSGYRPSASAITVRHAIGSLPPIAAGVENAADPMHVAPNMTGLTAERLAMTPHDGGSWLDLAGNPRGEHLLTPAMRRSAVAGAWGDHPDVYGRLWWDRPCVTIKRECAHVGNGRYAHPEQDRLCTVRELALLNGFPSDYEFVGRSLSNKYRHIGDAVPPLISHQLAHACHWMLTGVRPGLKDCLLRGTSLSSGDVISVDDESLLPLFANKGYQSARPAAQSASRISAPPG